MLAIGASLDYMRVKPPPHSPQFDSHNKLKIKVDHDLYCESLPPIQPVGLEPTTFP